MHITNILVIFHFLINIYIVYIIETKTMPTANRYSIHYPKTTRLLLPRLCILYAQYTQYVLHKQMGKTQSFNSNSKKILNSKKNLQR